MMSKLDSLVPRVWAEKARELAEKPNVVYDLAVKQPWSKTIENYARRWWQLWKPKVIDNPWYDPKYKPKGVKFKLPRLTR